jgi:hypothetical protein
VLLAVLRVTASACPVCLSQDVLPLQQRTSLLEGHARNYMPKNSKSAEEAAEDVIEIVRSYLK